jgi:hypothetical protein
LIEAKPRHAPSVLRLAVSEESVPTVDRIAKDGIDGFERVKQVDALVSQRGTASASMR